MSRRSRLRDDPAWRAMFARVDAKAKAAKRAEADRWRGLSLDEKLTEMAAVVGKGDTWEDARFAEAETAPAVLKGGM